MQKKRVVIALGGNALSPPKKKQSYQGLRKNIISVSKHLLPLLSNHEVVIVSGSGPQEGNLILQNECAKKKVSPLPLDVLDAEVEGELGYLIQQALRNELRKHQKSQEVITLLTQVVVNKQDPAFHRPTKPVGPVYTAQQAKKLQRKGWNMVNDAHRGYRRVVASPQPSIIIEKEAIINLLRNNMVVVAAGGGGIPVTINKNEIKGVQAVIDKDLASAVLAKNIKADFLLIITDVNKVHLHHGKKHQQPLTQINLQQAQQYMREGHFPEGNMGPKIQAAINFLKSSGKKVIITSPSSIEKALKGKEGTTITK
jgi:carbamate kinase